MRIIFNVKFPDLRYMYIKTVTLHVCVHHFHLLDTDIMNYKVSLYIDSYMQMQLYIHIKDNVVV